MILCDVAGTLKEHRKASPRVVGYQCFLCKAGKHAELIIYENALGYDWSLINRITLGGLRSHRINKISSEFILQGATDVGI